jgi:hypothetical protein
MQSAIVCTLDGSIRRDALATVSFRSVKSGNYPQPGIWEVTNLVHPKLQRKAISVTPLLLSVADDAA